MTYIIENHLQKDIYKQCDSNFVLSKLAPWETACSTHFKQQSNRWKQRNSHYNSTNERNRSSDEEDDDALPPRFAHMKQGKQVVVTRLSLNDNKLGDFYSADVFRDNQSSKALHSDQNSGDDFGQNFSDNECYNTSFGAAESMLMKKALKSATSIKNKKRRESISEVDTLARRRPVSTSIIPRLTKSSIILSSSERAHYINKGINSDKIPLLKQKRSRHYSLQPISQSDKDKLAASFFNENDEDFYLYHQQDDATAGVHWDPHIDAFEILRAKITGITRSMQEFHVKELFDDEKRKEKKLTATTSSPLITSASRNVSADRRFSLTNNTSFSNICDDSYHDNHNFSGHRRIQSQSHLPSTHNFDDLEDNNEEEDEIKVTSPNLTALFLTTNNLINSRLDEISETASVKSTPDDNNIDEVASKLEWQKMFLSLVTRCIHQSEQLESLSTDVLNTEHRVRELMLVNDTIHEQFSKREKQYEERIRECQEVAQQQLMMIDSLEELNADITMKIESGRRKIHQQNALLALDTNSHFKGSQQDNGDYYVNEGDNHRWDFRKSVAHLLNMDDKHDMIQKMRWEIGMFVGGGVGTGHIIHTYEDNLNGIDIMIAGTGTTTTTVNTQQVHYCDSTESLCNTNDDNCHNYQRELYSVTPSISRHLKLYQHQYILHLNSKDRRTRFALLPKSRWVPDSDTNRCQFLLLSNRKRCNTHFSIFQRKHHCRKCGYVMCQKHSANRLPLFSSSKRGNTVNAQWSRVCDNCFHNLIMQK